MPSIRTLVAVAAFAACGIAQAQEVTLFPHEPATGGKSRAEVVAETRAALAAGRLMSGNEGPGAFEPIVSTRDRESVRAEARAAVAERQSALAQWRERMIVGM